MSYELASVRTWHQRKQHFHGPARRACKPPLFTHTDLLYQEKMKAQVWHPWTKLCGYGLTPLLRALQAAKEASGPTIVDTASVCYSDSPRSKPYSPRSKP